MNWITSILLKLIIFIILIVNSTLSFTYINEINQYNYTEFYNLSLHYYDKTRNEKLIPMIQQMKGIYQNKSKSFEMNLQDTILITVLSYNEIHTKHYKIYFKNFLCFIQHYQLNILVYLVHHHIIDLNQEINELEQFVNNQNIRIITYPDALYWSLLSSKTNCMSKGKGKANYLHDITDDNHNTPSFTHHGALVMLVPVLEILELGYNVIFFDVDIGFVLDPIPYIIQGTADFAASIETRSCPAIYTTPSSTNTITTTISNKHLERDKYSTIEPNTGVMMIRATDNGVKFYKQWLHRIIQANAMNDQKVMQFKALYAVYNPDCFYSNALMKEPLSFKLLYASHNTRNNKEHLPSLYNNNSNNNNNNKSSNNATYCFLSELLFQNGETAFRCAIKPSYRDNFVLGMYQHGIMNPFHHPSPNNNISEHLKSQQQQQSHSRYPVLIHANYCDKKSHELNMRGLWLLNNNHSAISTQYHYNTSSMNVLKDNVNHCIDYKIYHTEYHSLNWTQEALKVYKKRRYIFKTFVKNNTLIRSSSSKTIYLITENKAKKIIPDINTFLYMFGESRLNEIKTLPHEVVDMIPSHEIPIFATIKEILVPQWINDASILISSTNSSTRNTSNQIKYIYRQIYLTNGTLLRLDDSEIIAEVMVSSKKNQQLVYMLDIIPPTDTSYHNNANNNNNSNNNSIPTQPSSKSSMITTNQVHVNKRQICDRESFLQYFQESQWKEIALVPSYILDSLTDGMPIMSTYYRYNCSNKITTTSHPIYEI